jgi:hypothetical protein
MILCDVLRFSETGARWWHCLTWYMSFNTEHSNASAKRAAHIEEPPDKNYVHHNEPRTGKGIHESSNAAKWESRVITLQAPQKEGYGRCMFCEACSKGTSSFRRQREPLN